MSDPPGADGKCQIRVLCMDCNESHAPGEGVHKYGKSWKCAKCHSAQRWLRENDPDWSGKSAQEKKELVLANRDHGGRGCARRLQTCHKVEVDHYENRDDEVPYLTKNRFIHKGMKWYGWTPEQAEDEWDKAVRDVNVKRRKDEYGELTIAKLKTAVHHVGVRVGNKRSIGETKKFNAEDQEAITDAKECVLRSRMDVEVGMSLPSIGDDDAGFARPKAKPKAKGRPKKASKKPKALGDGENENSEPSRKKARVDKEAKQRLDALKLQTDMVHMSQKWTSRIKTLNIEVTASIQSCQDFPHLAPLRDEVLKAFEKYAVAGPAVCASPSLTNTRLAMIQDSSVEPAPEVKVSRSAALVEPTKQGLQQYDKMMLDLESTLNRFIKQLDKETQEAQEVKEKNRILQEQLEKRLAKKKAASESAIEKGKKAGLRAAALEDSESGAGAKGTVVQAHDATTDDAGNDEGECEWKVGAELASRLEDTLPCENTVDLKHELAFIQPTVFGFPDAVDFTNYGYSIDFSCEIYKKNIPDEEEGDGANEMEGNPAYTSTTMLKDIVDPKTAINEKERIILDTVLFGPMKARECLGIDYPTSEYIKMLQGRLQYTGPEFTWCGLGKLFWGKMVCILSERITAGIPISHFVGDIEGGANFGDINTKFTRMSRDDVVKAGGFWAYLRQGQGIVIPPAYIIMDINRGAMDYTADAEDEETAIAAVDTMVFPTLTKDQIDNFDTSVYEVAIKACSGVFEKFGNELASGKELTNIVRAAVLSRTKHEDKTPSKEHTQLVEGTTEYINGSWTNAPESLSIALEMADKLFQLICRKAVDSDMDTDGSQQAALYSRVVDLLTGPLTSKVVTMGEMYDVGKQRQPHSEEFDTLWDDLIANAHHRIHCAMDDGDDLVAKLSKLSEPEIDILCKHVSLMDVFPTFQKWIQMTHGEQDLEFGDSNADRACQLHDFTHFMDSMQGETWDAFQVLLNIKSGGLVSSAASGADKSTVVDLGKPNPSQAAEHVDTTMEKISPEASLPDTLPAQFPEKNDEAPAYEAKSPPPAKPMASSAAKSPTMLPPSVPKQSEALAKNASPVPALQPPIPKPIEAVAKSISAAAPPPKATPPGEEEPKGAKPTAMKSAQTSSKAMTSVSVEASSTEKTDKVDVAGGKATMETIGGVPVAKSPVAKPTTKAKAAAEPDNTAKPIPAAKAKTMSVPKAKAKADATPTPSVAEETTKKKRHSKQDQVDNFFNISQRKASKDKEPKTPKTSTSKASAKGKTKK